MAGEKRHLDKFGHPNLKSGNSVGVGRMRKEFRLKAVAGANNGVAYWSDIAAGLKCIPVYDALGAKKKGKRYPTHAERMEAISKLAEYGPGKSDKLEVEDVTPIDKDALRKQLLDQAEEIRRSRAARVAGGEPGSV